MYLGFESLTLRQPVEIKKIFAQKPGFPKCENVDVSKHKIDSNPHNNKMEQTRVPEEIICWPSRYKKHIAGCWRVIFKTSDRLFHFLKKGASNDQGKNHRKGWGSP